MLNAFLSAATAAMANLSGYAAKVAALPTADREFFKGMREMRNDDSHAGGAPIDVTYDEVPLFRVSREELGGVYEVTGPVGFPPPTFARRVQHFKLPDGSKVEVRSACRRYLDIVGHLVTGAPLNAALRPSAPSPAAPGSP